MPSLKPDTNLYYSTYTNLNWLLVLKRDKHKQIIIDSLNYLSKNHRVIVYGFVIMPNHIHLIWQIINNDLPNVQRDFLKYTAQQIKFSLIETNDQLLDDLVVNAKDRKVQIWERNGLSFVLKEYTTAVQKLNYIHNNPIQEKWKLANTIEEYYFSSAAFYFKNETTFAFLRHLNEIK
ncbi:MAG: transposase [Bacteroidetes bacterium]|nr:transposase [Bacteroidota bacterium]